MPHDIDPFKTEDIFNISPDDNALIISAKMNRAIAARIRLSEMIYDAMATKGISKEDMALYLKSDVNLVSKALTGKINFSIDTLMRFEQILEVDLISSALFDLEKREEYRVRVYDRIEQNKEV